MTLNELQILLALNGDTRIEYAECEIFASSELCIVYLESLCSKYDWYKHYKKGCDGELAFLAYRYACDAIKDRWAGGEAVIATSPQWACLYTRFVTKCRWLEVESVIATNPRWAYEYARGVIRGRFPSAERVIASYRSYAKWYNDLFGTNI